MTSVNECAIFKEIGCRCRPRQVSLKGGRKLLRYTIREGRLQWMGPQHWPRLHWTPPCEKEPGGDRRSQGRVQHVWLRQTDINGRREGYEIRRRRRAHLEAEEPPAQTRSRCRELLLLELDMFTKTN